MKQQGKKMQERISGLQQSQAELLYELRNQQDRHRKLVERLQGDITEVEKIKGKRVLMVNDGNISLPLYDYLHYNKIFDDIERRKRAEMLHLLNRYGESIVAFFNPATTRLSSQLLRQATRRPEESPRHAARSARRYRTTSDAQSAN